MNAKAQTQAASALRQRPAGSQQRTAQDMAKRRSIS
jgi:hypothetical protein